MNTKNNEILKNGEFGQTMELVTLTDEIRKKLNELVKGNIQNRVSINQTLTLLYSTCPLLGFKFSASRYARVSGTIYRHRKSSIGYIAQRIYEELENYEKFLKKTG